MKKRLFGLSLAAFLTFGVFSFLTNKIIAFEIMTGGHFFKEVEPEIRDVYAHKHFVPSDPNYNEQKNFSMNQVGDIESIWDTYTGKGTTVAIIDSGFAPEHEEYVRKDGSSAILSTSRYYYSNGFMAGYKNFSEDPTCLNHEWDTTYNEWDTHGTTTSTTTAAPVNDVGGVGIAPDADILALKIDMSFIAIEGAITYAIEQGVDVINMSLGAYGESFTDGFGYEESGSAAVAEYLEEVCQAAYDAGIIVVASAGNEATSRKSYPACNSHVVGVGALAKNSTDLSYFTNFNESADQGDEKNVDILAPGFVYTASITGSSSDAYELSYRSIAGTSFSAPIVSGAACLWKEANPDGKPDQFLSDVKLTAAGIGEYVEKTVDPSAYSSKFEGYGPYTANISEGRLDVSNLMNAVRVEAVSVDDTASVGVGDTVSIPALVAPSDALNKSVRWEIDDPTVAYIKNEYGNPVEIQGIKNGIANVTVRAVENPSIASSLLLTVGTGEEFPIQSISLDDSSMTLQKRESKKLAYSVFPDGASRLVKWESSNPDVVSVDNDGLIHASEEGVSVIKVTSLKNSSLFSTCTVTVSGEATLQGYELVTSASQLIAGDQYVIASNSHNATAGTFDTTKKIMTKATSTFTSGNKQRITSLGEGTLEFTLRGKPGSWLFEINGEYLSTYSPSNGTMYMTDFFYDDWTITVSDKQVDIYQLDYSVRIKYNSTYSQFKCYSTAPTSSIPLPELYHGIYGDGVTYVSQINVSPSTQELDLNGNRYLQLEANVLPSNAFDTSYTWESANTKVATVNEKGFVTAVGEGDVTIVARANDASGVTGTASISVIDTSKHRINTVGGPKTLTVGCTIELNANCDHTCSEMVWEIVSGADVVEIDSTSSGTNLHYCIFKGLKAGTAIIKVSCAGEGEATKVLTVLDYSEKSGSGSQYETWDLVTNESELHQGDNIIIAGLNVSYAISKTQDTSKRGSASITKNTSENTATFGTSVQQICLMGSSGSWVFGIPSYDGTRMGYLRANGGASNGLYTNTTVDYRAYWTISFEGNEAFIQCTANYYFLKYYSGFGTYANINKDGERVCIYKYVYDDSPKVTGFSISPTALSLDIYNNSTATLTPSITAEEGADTTVTYTSSNSSVAKVNSAGEVLAKGVGTAKITAKCGKKTAHCNVSVTNSTPVTDVIFDNVEVSLYVGETLPLIVTVLPENAANKTLTWTSSNSEVATISNNTITALKAGSAVITATSVNGISATCEVTVSNKAVESVSLNTSSLDLYIGHQETLVATVSPSNATIKDVIWSSSNEDVATVTNGAVTGLKQGLTTISCTTVDGGFVATCEVNVIPVLVESLSFDFDSIEMSTNSSRDISLNVLPLDFTHVDQIVWSTSNDQIVTVSGSGTSATLTAVGNPGDSATINASVDGQSASLTVNVVSKALTITGYSETVPFAGTFSTSNIKVYYGEDVVTPDETNYSVNTKVLGYHVISATYNGVTAVGRVKVTNVGSSSNVGETSTNTNQYRFTSKAWADSTSSWTSGKDGTAYKNSGVQVSSSTSGANATTKSSFSGVTSVVVRYCANASTAGSGTITIKVGSATNSRTLSNQTGTSEKSFSLAFSSASGTVKITVDITKSSLYIMGVDIVRTTAYNATPLEQAKAYSTYFLSQTNGLCNNDPTLTDVTSLKGIWSDLKSEYDAMTSASKTKFIGDSDSVINEARDRYSYAVRNHSELENYISGLVSLDKAGNILNNNSQSNLTMIVLLIGMASTSLVFLLILKKKRLNK